MATSSNDSGFESAVNAIFGYDISLEKLLWKLCPVYFKVKCKEDFITTVQICTSEDGKKVYLKIYVINELSLSRIAYITTCLDAFTRSFSDKWNEFTYTFQTIVPIGKDHKVNKYTFVSENNTNEDLAGKNQTFISMR